MVDQPLGKRQPVFWRTDLASHCLCCHDHHRSTHHTFLLQAPSVVDAFQQAVPTHMQQRPGSMPRPDLMRPGFRPPAARPIANGLAPLKPYSNGPPFGNGPGARPFNQGNFAAEPDFGRFGMPLPNIVPPSRHALCKFVRQGAELRVWRQ